MIVSRMTSKAQTTIPQAVRRALKLRPGDAIAYEIRGDRVLLSRSSDDVADDPFAVFDEWRSEADRRAYADL